MCYINKGRIGSLKTSAVIMYLHHLCSPSICSSYYWLNYNQNIDSHKTKTALNHFLMLMQIVFFSV